MNMHISNALLLPVVFLCGAAAAFAQASAPVIRETTEPKGWVIETKSSSYRLLVTDKGEVFPAFYGNKAGASSTTRNDAWQQSIMEIPVRGAYPNKTPALEVIFSGRVRDLDLQFVSGNILEIENRPALVITQRDRFYPLQVVSYIRVLPEYDILEKWIELKNTGEKESILIENARSGSIVLPRNAYELTHLAGTWGNEFQVQRAALTPGVKTLEAADFKSFETPPWFLIRPRGQHDKFSGPGWFGTIQYSGNWRMDMNTRYGGGVQVVAGINFWDTHWNLEPGKTFVTPKFVIGYTGRGDEGAAQSLSRYIRKEVLPASHREKLRPVLYNSWYATKFNIRMDQQLALAKIAAEIGVEMFVMDDGWFKGRVNDRAGLGDWTVDKKKFPDGLGPLIRQVNELGMDFGIWIEPEMVNPDSDLYRRHPDWVFHFPNRARHESRNQLMLNLAREDVFQYLLKCYTSLLSENNIKFIKWDHNRALSEPGWPDAPAEMQREARIRHIDNLYRLIDTLRKRFPDVWFEDCSSGGGRPDIGMLARMDQVWVSDNTAPKDRLYIQHGFLSAWPANTMVAWTTDHMQNTSLEFTFDVMMSGVLGIGNDLSKWGDKEKALAKRKIELYKAIRPLVQQGTACRLISPFEDFRAAVEYVAEDKSEAVVFCYNLADDLAKNRLEGRGDLKLRLQGLDGGARYTIEFCGLAPDKQPRESCTGDFLENIGLRWIVSEAGKSQIIRLRKTE